MAGEITDKKKWEVNQCRLVAEELNRRGGTDYRAIPSDEEPADVMLVSPSEKHKPLPIQVVSIPIDFRHRDDKHSIERFKRYLSERLARHGMRQLLVGIIPTGRAEMHGFPPPVAERILEIVVREAANGKCELRYDDIHRLSTEASEYVHDIVISFHDFLEAVEVEIPGGSAIPFDGRWIEEGIEMKLRKYGGFRAVKDLTLVIGVAGFVDDEQVRAFQTAHPPKTLPFLEIWIVTPFHGTICLKQLETRKV